MSSADSRFWSLAFANAGHFTAHLCMLLYPTVVLSLGPEFGHSYGSLLSLSVPGFVLFGAAALPAGWLGDRWGTRGMMAVFFLGTGAAAVVTGLAVSPLTLALGLALIGVFASIYHPVGIAWLVGVAKNRGRALGINGVFGNLGIALAAGVAGGLTTLVSWRAAFIVPGLLAIALGLVFLVVIRDTAAAGEKGPGQGNVVLSRREMWQVVVVLAVTFSCGGLVFQATSVALPKLFADRLSSLASNPLGVGGFVSLVYGLGSLAQILTGMVTDRYALRPVYVLIYLVQAPVLVVAAGLSGLPLLLVAQLSVFLAMGAIPITDMLVARYTPAALRGRMYGLKFVLSLGVASLGVPMVALIRDYSGGFTELLLVLAALAATVMTAALFLPRERSGPGAPVPSPAMAAGAQARD